MEPVIVFVYAVVDADAVDVDVLALQYAAAVVGATGEKGIAQKNVFAFREDQQMRPFHVAGPLRSARAGAVANAVIEIHALAIDRTAAFDSDVLGIGGVKQREVAVAGGYPFAGGIILDFAAAEDSTLGRQVERDIAFQLHGAAKKIAGRHQDDSAAIAVGGVDGCLNGGGVESCSITLRAEIADVVDQFRGGFRSGTRRIRIVGFTGAGG